MTFPATCTLVGNFVDTSGQPARGQITLTPTAELTDPDGGLILPALPIEVFVGSGTFSIALVPTDAPGIVQQGWTYKVSEQLNLSPNRPGTTNTEYFIAPTGTGTVDLASLAQYTEPPAVETYLPLVGGTVTGDLTVLGDTTLNGSTALNGGATASGTDPSTLILQADVTGDSDPRLSMQADGTVNWGAGSTAPDTNLYRGGEGLLQSDGVLRFGNAPSPASVLPYGYSDSSAPTGLVLNSSYPSDDVVGGIDGTGRLNLYSYQRANVNSFGETIRNFLMRYDAKAMTAWYGPTGLYDGSGNPVGSTWKPWTWTGSHYESNDHTAIHGHWEVEVPDSTGALQGRFIVPFVDDWPSSPTYGQVGVDVSDIHFNQANVTIDAGFGAYRIATVAGTKDRVLEFANSIYAANTAAVRWRLLANNTAETGANTGTDFALRRFDDTGNQVGTALFVQRSDGQITSGAAGAKSARWAAVWGSSGIHGFSAQPTSTPGAAAAFDAQLTGTTDRAVQSMVTGDSSRRYVVFADGKTQWGPGSATQDANLYRSSVGLLKTDTAFEAGTQLAVGAAPNGTDAVTVSLATDSNTLNLLNTDSSGNLSGAHVRMESATSTSIAVSERVTGDSSSRFLQTVDGKMNWGPGNASRDTNLYRSNTGVLQTDNSFQVGTNLRINTSSVGGGSGVIGMANATAAPSLTPTGGGVIYVSGGALLYKGSSGTVTTLAPA